MLWTWITECIVNRCYEGARGLHCRAHLLWLTARICSPQSTAAIMRPPTASMVAMVDGGHLMRTPGTVPSIVAVSAFFLLLLNLSSGAQASSRRRRCDVVAAAHLQARWRKEDPALHSRVRLIEHDLEGHCNGSVGARPRRHRYDPLGLSVHLQICFVLIVR